MTYGRPMMMHPAMTRQTLAFPSMIDDVFLTRHPEPPGSQPAGIPSLMASYSCTLGLQEILGEMLSAFYQNDQSRASTENNNTSEATNSTVVGRLKSGDFQDLFRLDTRLGNWYEGLPKYLKVNYDMRSDLEYGPAVSETSLQNNDSIVPLWSILARQANALRTR